MIFTAMYRSEINGEYVGFYFELESLADIPADCFNLEYTHNLPDYLWC